MTVIASFIADLRYARAVLAEAGGNKSEAARILKIDYKTLEKRLRYGED